MDNGQQNNPSIPPESASTDARSLDSFTSAQSLDEPYTASASSRTGAIVQEEAPLIQSPGRLGKLWKRILIGALAFIVLAGGALVLLRAGDQKAPTVKAGSFDTLTVPLSEFSAQQQVEGAGQKLTVNGRLQVANSLVISPTVQPTVGVTGQLYYDQASNVLAYYNGTQFVSIGGGGAGAVTINNFGGTTVIQGGGGSGGAVISGTPGQLVKFTGASTIGDSIARDEGTTLRVNGNVNLVSTVTVTPAEITAFTTSDVPDLLNLTDENRPLEVGVKFRTDVSGFVRGVRFYKGNLNTGTHIGSLWSSSGAQLASGTFVNETASGWQELRFNTPIAISADTTYIVSYHSTGYYSATSNAFGTSGKDKESLHILRNGDDGGNGVFNYGTSSVFPTRSSQASNYFVDVIFLPNPPPNRYQINGVQIASSDLANNTDIAKRSSSQIFVGNNTFRPSVNSASAFSVQASSGAEQLTVSTSEFRVYIGPATGVDLDVTILVLGNRRDPGDPNGGTEGAIYYNSSMRSFRCYRSGAWDNCAQLEADHSFGMYEEFLGNQNTSFVTNTFGTLGWQGVAIGANGTVSFDPTTPTPSADRPGVLAYQTPAVANQGTTFVLGNSAGSVLLAKDNIVKFAVAVGSTDQVLRVGLHNQTSTTTQPVSGIWWEANPAVDARWRHCVGNGTTAACTPSNTNIAANSWVRLELRVKATGNGTSEYESFINGNLISTTGVNIDTTNRVAPALSCYTTVSTAQNCYWDYYQFKGTTATGR